MLRALRVGKHFRLKIDSAFSFERDDVGIAEEAALDRIYHPRTSVKRDALSSEQAVRTYKIQPRRAGVSTSKSVDLHRAAHPPLERVRGARAAIMLASNGMRRALAPMLFDDEDHGACSAFRW